MYFFFMVLGVCVMGYLVNCYGIFGGGDVGDESDWFDVEWVFVDIVKLLVDDVVVEILEILVDIEVLCVFDLVVVYEWCLCLCV